MCLFLDIDGTLLDFVDSPRLVAADAELVDLLNRAAGATLGALALVSGRSLAQIDALFAPLRLPAAGLHGLERRTASGARQDVPVLDKLPQAARDYLVKVATRHPGLLLEDKGATVALHYRLAPDLQQTARHAMAVALAQAGPGYMLLMEKW